MKITTKKSNFSQTVKTSALSFIATSLLLVTTTSWSQSSNAAAAPSLVDIVVVGNAIDGTVDFIDIENYSSMGTVNIAPDLWLRLLTMPLNTLAWGFNFIREGGQRILDDIVVTRDGKTLVASRGWIGDVAAFDLTKKNTPMIWRFDLPGLRADHMDISPDGSRIVVSDTLSNKAFILNPFTGDEIGSFPTGEYAHGNDYSHDGKYIYNGSIGSILLPYFLNALKGEKSLTIADAQTSEVIRTLNFDWGVRPTTFTKDNSTMYAQFSYQRGFSTVDLETGEILDTYDLPGSDYATQNYPKFDKYPNNSAHHGMALSGDEKKLCLAGTIDNYIAIVDLESKTTDNIIEGPQTPYWATLSHDGNYCYVSNSNGDSVSIVAFATATEVARVPVGRFPQRSRAVQVLDSVLNNLFGG